MFKQIKDKFEIWCDSHENTLLNVAQWLLQAIKSILEIIATVVLYIPMVFLYSLVLQCGYMALGVNFTELPEVTYWAWVGVAIFATAVETVLVTPNYPRSESEMEYMKAYGKTWMGNRIKACIVIILISLMYYGLGN